MLMGATWEWPRKARGSPFQIRTTQESDLLKAALKDTMDIPQNHNHWIRLDLNKAHSKNMRRKLEREYM